MERIKKVIFIFYKLIFKVVGIILPKNNNLVIFESFLGKQYSDNPRAIYEYLRERYPSYKLYWSFDNKVFNISKDLPVVPIKRFSLKWLFLMNRAKYWVSNSRMPLWIPKPNNTIYIQTWHGTPLKKLAIDMEEVHMPGTDTESYKKNFITESSKWDYLISPNAYSTEIFKRAFKFKNKLLETGYPRNDFLFQKNSLEEIEKIKKLLGLPLDKKVILYAPTWRDNKYYKKGSYKFDIPMDLKNLHENLGDEYVFLLRMHYLVSENLAIEDYEDFIFDVSKHEDIRELYLIADMLITDYSSVFFDYANLKRPMLFYVHDIEEYRDTLRGFYFDFENDAPGPLVQTTRGLITEIKRINDFNDKKEEVIKFSQKFCYMEDGKATERVVKAIFDHKE